MSISVLRILSSQIDLQRIGKSQTVINIKNVNPQVDIHKQYVYSSQFLDNFPNHLIDQIENIYKDTMTINKESYSQQAFMTDMDDFEQIQTMLSGSLQTTTSKNFYKSIVNIFAQASIGHIGQFHDRLKYVQFSIQQELKQHQKYIQLYHVIDFLQQKQMDNRLDGIYYLVQYFRQLNLEGHLQQSQNASQSMVSTQLSFYQQQQYSKFEKPFYQFLTGQIIENSNNYSIKEQNLIACLNDLTRNNYVLPQQSYEQFVNADNDYNFTQSKSHFDQDKDVYYKVLMSLLGAGELSESIHQQISAQFPAPFAVQVFFKLIYIKNVKLFGISLQQSQYQQQTFSKQNGLFMLALEGKIFDMLQYMQRYGMYVEMLILSYFIQNYIVQNCHIPQNIQEIDIGLLKYLVQDNVVMEQDGHLQIVRCYLEAIKIMRNEIITSNSGANLFCLFDNDDFKLIEDILETYVEYLIFNSNYQPTVRLHNKNEGNLNQRYMLAILLVISGSCAHAYELLVDILHDIYLNCYLQNQYDQRRYVDSGLLEINQNVQEYLLMAEQRLVLDKLFQPRDLNAFERQVLDVNEWMRTIYQGQPDNVNMRAQALDVLFVQLTLAYHANASTSKTSSLLQACADELGRQARAGSLSVHFVNGINELARLLLMTTLKIRQHETLVRTTVCIFQQELDERCKQLLLQLQ